MGFNSVYSVLLEIFPQVDSRVLKAVAIEHSKDAGVAVEVVLVDVMPFSSMQVGSHTSSIKGPSSPNSSEAVEAVDSAVQTYDALPYANGGNVGVEENRSNEQISFRKCGGTSKVVSDLSHMDSTSLIYENGAIDDLDQLHEDSVSEKVISSQRYQESSPEEDIEVLNRLSGLTRPNGELHADIEDMNWIVNYSSVHEEQLSLDGNPLEKMHTTLQVDQSPAQNCITDASESSLQLVAVPFKPIPDVEEPEPNNSLIAVSEKGISSSEMVDCENESTVNTKVLPETAILDVENQEPCDSCVGASEQSLSTSEMDDLDDENTLNAIVRTQSGQICSTELLEDIIENARSEKIALRSAKNSLISLMKEVELKEKSVEEAKEEAARGGLVTNARVHELKQMLERAKEANDMHAGEVYGEEAILGTEARELQSRLLNLSDETAKALAILDEMRQSLEVRLTVAEKEIKAAEHERLDKEESARKSLAYEESVMERVVQESKILKQEAEENSKLSQFLMDCGQSVDMLQGEISVLYQDIKLMKEKFDQRLPLSKSLALSQTTCVLATSSLSLISTAAEQVPELADSTENSKAIPTSSSDDQLPCGEDAPNHHKELMEDGWEFFDNNGFRM